MKLAKVYEPQAYEPNTYALWETAKAFAPGPDKGQGTYSIVMPPPNANGNLHIGHALMAVLEDALIRYHRMKGERTAYIPGADHAGFETWVVFERQLEKTGKSRFDYSREQLYEMTWDFVAKNRGGMELQLRELGVSCDWDNLAFTLDKKVIDTTYTTFKKMWDDKLIYRGKRLVNYCTTHHTGFSDIEVEYIDRTTPLYYMQYGPFVVATTRPETKFGDTAVAVHPEDERYKQFVGQALNVEGVNGPFTITVVADAHVDPEFGTGVVKITPAHDFNDWDIAQRHGLPAVQVIDQHGKMMEKAGRFAGMPVLEARAAVVAALKEKNLLVKTDEHYKNRVGVCYKCKTVIEPMLLDQWFVHMPPLAKPAIKAIKQGDVTFYPENKGKVLINYLEGIHDWNISRQIPWGIPIPAFQNVDDADDWIFDTRVTHETIEVDGKTYRRDPDTFDTWFSSGQWPYITTDYLDEGTLSDFYPASVMETGHDILFPWVARMIMMGLYRTSKAPFKDVYLHGLVLDEHGQKMSKSKGNVLNPQEMVAEYGSDALRMGLIANRSAGMNQAFSTASVVAGRNFANKLWNMARYIEDKVGDDYAGRGAKPTSIADHWVLGQIDKARSDISSYLEAYRFSEAFETMYHLVWDDVADWYLEASKIEPNIPLLAHILETILALAHPFAPFVTETIWQTLAWEQGLLISARWPEKPDTHSHAKATQFTALQSIITEARFVANELGQGKQTLIYRDEPLLDAHPGLVQKLANLHGVEKITTPRGLRLAIARHEAWLDINDHALAKHRHKLNERLAAVNDQLAKLSARLANESYIQHAPKEVVAQTHTQLAEQKALADRLAKELEIIDK